MQHNYAKNGLAAAAVAVLMVLGGCSGNSMGNADINPPDKGLIHYLKQSQMTNVSDNGYKVAVDAPVSPIESGNQAELTMQVLDPSGLPALKFTEDMTKLMHLIVVSADLSSFAHLHPEYKGNGVFKVTYRFPYGGKFLLIAEFMPDDKGLTVYKQWVTVAGSSPDKARTASDASFRKTIDGLEVSMSVMPDPEQLAAGETAMLHFYVTDAATRKPVLLEPYLGTAGHCVILNESADKYLHVHAADGTSMGSGEYVMFHTQFPASDTYKIWFQFQYKGNVYAVPFVLEVR